MVFCIHFCLWVEAWSANFCSFPGEGVSSETNFVRFAGLLRTFAMAPNFGAHCHCTLANEHYLTAEHSDFFFFTKFLFSLTMARLRLGCIKKPSFLVPSSPDPCPVCDGDVSAMLSMINKPFPLPNFSLSVLTWIVPSAGIVVCLCCGHGYVFCSKRNALKQQLTQLQ